MQALPDWDQAELVTRAAHNPFAVVALAQLAAHRRSSDPERQAQKSEIIRLLYRYRYARKDAIQLLRFIDWLIRLPRSLELALRQELAELEEHAKMSYVTSWERFAREEGVLQGRKEGWQQGLQEGREEGREEGHREGEARALMRLLQAKFGALSPELEARIASAAPEQVEAWLMRVLAAARLQDVFDAH